MFICFLHGKSYLMVRFASASFWQTKYQTEPASVFRVVSLSRWEHHLETASPKFAARWLWPSLWKPRGITRSTWRYKWDQGHRSSSTRSLWSSPGDFPEVGLGRGRRLETGFTRQRVARNWPACEQRRSITWQILRSADREGVPNLFLFLLLYLSLRSPMKGWDFTIHLVWSIRDKWWSCMLLGRPQSYFVSVRSQANRRHSRG